jgi:hypothetical protein
VLRGAFTESDTGAAELAEEGAGAVDFFDHGGFAKAHFAETLADFGLAFQFADACTRSGRELGEKQALWAKWVDSGTHKGEGRTKMRMGFRVNELGGVCAEKAKKQGGGEVILRT